MNRKITTTLVAGAASVAVAASTLAGAGNATAQGKGVEITAVDNGNCTATFTLTNYTNTRFYQPDGGSSRKRTRTGSMPPGLSET